MGRYPNLFQFQCDSDSNSDTSKHLMFTGVGIGTTMLSIVIPNYFPVLVLKRFHLEQGENNPLNQLVLMATFIYGCCESEVYQTSIKRLPFSFTTQHNHFEKSIR